MLHVPEELEDILPPRSARAQIKQLNPYLPSHAVDKMLNVVEDKDTTSGNLKASGYCSKLIVNKKKRETAKRKGPKQYEEGDIEEFETMQ